MKREDREWLAGLPLRSWVRVEELLQRGILSPESLAALEGRGLHVRRGPGPRGRGQRSVRVEELLAAALEVAEERARGPVQ